MCNPIIISTTTRIQDPSEWVRTMWNVNTMYSRYAWAEMRFYTSLYKILSPSFLYALWLALGCVMKYIVNTMQCILFIVEREEEGVKHCQFEYLQTTLSFHVDSRNRPVTAGFSARHNINFPSSSTPGEKLSSDLVVLFKISSLINVTYISYMRKERREKKKKFNEEKNKKIKFFFSLFHFTLLQSYRIIRFFSDFKRLSERFSRLPDKNLLSSLSYWLFSFFYSTSIISLIASHETFAKDYSCRRWRWYGAEQREVNSPLYDEVVVFLCTKWWLNLALTPNFHMLSHIVCQRRAMLVDFWFQLLMVLL